MMLLLFRYVWIVFVIVTCVNGAIWWYRARPRIARDPGLEEGYRQLIQWWVICGNLPWLVMGAGILFGGVPTVFHYFNPRNGPFVIAFYVTTVILWVASFYWLFFRKGAEQLVTHPGLLNFPVESPRAVKMFFLLTLAGGLLGLSVMLLGDIQVPLPPPSPR